MILSPLLSSLVALAASMPRFVERQTTNAAPTASSLMDNARASLAQNDTQASFGWLTRAHALDPHAVGLKTCFEDVFRARIRLHPHDNAIDRLGLGSLLVDRGCYPAAAMQFQAALTAHERQEQSLDAATVDRATSSLYKARAAICDWTDDFFGASLVASVQSGLHAVDRIPSVHPYEALMWPCLSIQDATHIANQYAQRAMDRANVVVPNTVETARSTERATGPFGVPLYDQHQPVPCMQVISHPAGSPQRQRPRHRIRLGYISNDFTGKHPLGLLMQDVFGFHNLEEIEVYMYSLMEYDDSPEVAKMRQAVTEFKVLDMTTSPQQAAQTVAADNLDVLVDLTGYTGTSVGVEIMAQRVAAVQMGHMGFPASSGAPFMDYLVCDETTVPPSLRHHYAESLFVMPHCFFANSHKYLEIRQGNNRQALSRQSYDLPEDAFVYCCHNRPEKIDAVTFWSWCRVLWHVPNSVLWILSSGAEMEQNLIAMAEQTFGLSSDRLVFCDKVPRDEHLQRLELADLFLDTPAYNAHTVGCDCLSAGVPMVSLLRDDDAPNSVIGSEGVATEKMASRVGASFLRTLQLDELVASTMADYEAIMIRCATDSNWFAQLAERLDETRKTSPLFDMDRWVRNWEAGIVAVATNRGARGKDVFIVERGRS